MRQAILNALTADGKYVDPVDAIQPFIDKLREMALAGDMAAIREMFDRLEGKPAQQVQLQGDDDQPLKQNITVEFVKQP